MKFLRAIPSKHHAKQGIALIMVLAILSLATVLVIALFSLTDSEFKATTSYTSGQSARQFADSGVNIVISQLQSAVIPTTPGAKEIWASQPGALRKYTAGGKFIRGYRLFSDANMVHTAEGPAGEAAFVASSPPADWNTKPAKYVDINQPIVRAESGAGATVTTRAFFPVIDPRAMNGVGSGTAGIEGFEYAPNILNQTTAPDVSVETIRLPMPVEWIYVLKDGTLGTLDAGNTFIGGTPTEANPIVGRVAFWTDDETCKININTASEPTYWAPPNFFHQRNYNWAASQPSKHEFQRYPGHPATVSLSAVLYPSLKTDYGFSMSVPTKELTPDEKEIVYAIAPKIEGGGSKAGTIRYNNGKPATTNTFLYDEVNEFEQIELVNSSSERLFASLDELIFGETMQGRERSVNQLLLSGSGNVLNRDWLERCRGFLTANSRSPETNIFGLPRVSMWPVSGNRGNRTGYDRTIAFCGSLSPQSKISANVNLGDTGNLYYFQRVDADHPFTDVRLERNRQLLAYLDEILTPASSPFQFPSRAGAQGANSGANFAAKFNVNTVTDPQTGVQRQNTRQILVEIFDYIRCTNLYDSHLDTQLDSNGKPVKDAKGDPIVPLTKITATDITSQYRNKPNPGTYQTFTEPKFRYNHSESWGSPPRSITYEYKGNGWPGHGQVTPAQWDPGGTYNTAGAGSTFYQGFGRFPTLTEAALHFICCADAGDPSVPTYTDPVGRVTKTMLNYDAQLVNPAPAINKTNGGFYAFVLDQNNPLNPNSGNQVWSNFPPIGRGGRGTTPGAHLLPVMVSTGNPSLNSPFAASGQRIEPFINGAPNTAHPGWKPENWNTCLENNTPVPIGYKRVQAVMYLEYFVAAAGWTGIHPNFSVEVDITAADFKVDGVEMTVQGTVVPKVYPLFPVQNTRVTPTFNNVAGGDGIHSIGGMLGFRSFLRDRYLPPRSKNSYDGDTLFDKSGNVERTRRNYELVSNYIDVPRNGTMKLKCSGDVIVNIYDDQQPSHLGLGGKGELVQSVRLRFPDQADLPVPELATGSKRYVKWVDNDGRVHDEDQVDAPRWWTFYQSGCLARFSGTHTNPVLNERSKFPPYDNRANDRPSFYGRFYLPGNNAASFTDMDPDSVGLPDALKDNIGGSNWGRARIGAFIHNGDPRPGSGASGLENGDVIRSLLVRHGDYRITAAKRFVPSTDFVAQRNYTDSARRMAHQLSHFASNNEGSADRFNRAPVTNEGVLALVSGANYRDDQKPDIPVAVQLRPWPLGVGTDAKMRPAALAQRYGDFDNGTTTLRDGAYINKPDEGNTSKVPGVAYFGDSWRSSPAGETFQTPNRQIASPGMFGSLSSNVWGDSDYSAVGAPIGGSAELRGLNGAWRTLLFRPQATPSGQPAPPSAMHPGAPNTVGGVDPADHYLMDLFWMPVVQPYAISEPFSTAGKINLNYQILPFKHITRATGIYAALKGELFEAIPRSDADKYKVAKAGISFDGTTSTDAIVRNESVDQAFWHRRVNVPETLKQFDFRFRCDGSTQTAGLRGLFVSASEICEVHLIPRGTPRDTANGVTSLNITGSPTNAAEVMGRFWKAHAITGDNVRERPYTNIYPKLTTRSNTFKVYVRAQAVKKARSVDPAVIDLTRDTIVGDYRGSSLLERYIDPSDNSVVLPDYAASAATLATQPSIDEFARVRVLETKQFNP